MQALLGELHAWSPVELVAAVMALLYLVLAARQNPWCWPCALVSTAIYLWLFFERAIYQQALLQVFYIAMAIYGWWHWRGADSGAGPLRVSRWKPVQHAIAAALVLVLTLTTGWAEARFTPGPFPYLDAFTTWGSVVTTWMVARKVLENWLYWLVVDSVMVYLSYVAALPATALLFVIYLGIVVAGFFAWRRSLPA
ncbi:MAG TPA: nicotinamide riboside transporter PnuC [Steroidobacteraceae bacterium]|nr:nicotinamide riboside transporter PnuC [Steroidobacteraceae bacterium]